MNEELTACYQAPYIVWVYYYSGGWRPQPQASWEDAMNYVLNGPGQPCVVTSGAFKPARP